MNEEEGDKDQKMFTINQRSPMMNQLGDLSGLDV
ncbi:hypothetical protein N483_15665 [Pseudoalteromonas luteoviolacea NCIMB 1944]|nr:hypothetical protein N483_15665 [Pseudoalteromonas luteoviolacea NCIMB 1944]